MTELACICIIIVIDITKSIQQQEENVNEKCKYFHIQFPEIKESILLKIYFDCFSENKNIKLSKLKKSFSFNAFFILHFRINFLHKVVSLFKIFFKQSKFSDILSL